MWERPPKQPCGNCGSLEYIRWMKRGNEESCDRCGEGTKGNYFTDAAGDKIAYSEDLTGKYSYALGTVVKGKRHFSECLHKMNLVQHTKD